MTGDRSAMLDRRKEDGEMIILAGECGCGKTEIQNVLIRKYGYQQRMAPSCDKTVCVLPPDALRRIKQEQKRRRWPAVHIFYIKVQRKDRLIRMFQRGDDIDEAIERDRADLKRYRGIENEADFVLNNNAFFSDPENMAYWIIECIRGNYKNK